MFEASKYYFLALLLLCIVIIQLKLFTCVLENFKHFYPQNWSSMQFIIARHVEVNASNSSLITVRRRIWLFNSSEMSFSNFSPTPMEEQGISSVHLHP